MSLKQKKKMWAKDKIEPQHVYTKHELYSLPFYLSISSLPLSNFFHVLKFLIQTGVPPDDTSLCDFQAWLLSFTGMWLSVYWQ